MDRSPGIDSAGARRLLWPVWLILVVAGVLATRDGCTASGPDPTARRRGDPATSSRATASQASPAPPSLADQASVLGELRLEGRVIDQHDRAVAGAVVTVDGRRTVETEADGSFGIDGVAEGQHDVTAEYGEQFAEDQTWSLDATSEPLILTLARGPTLVVHVTDLAGKPLRGAAVSVSSRTLTTGDDGTVRFRTVATDSDWVDVVAPGKARHRARVATSDDPGAIVERTIALDRGAELSGVVLDRSGAPVADAYVELTPPGRRRGESTFTDDTGAWHVPDLGPGAYAAHASSRLHIAAPDVTIEHDGVHPRADVVLRVDPGGEIAGLVVDASGAPVAEAELTTSTGSATSDARGRFVITGLGPDTYEVTAVTKALGAPPVKVTLARGQRVELRIALAPSGFAGLVVDAAGDPVEGAMVWASGGHGQPVGSAWTDDHGRFELGIPPGRYRLTAERRNSSIEGPAIDAATGARKLRLVVGDAATITGRVVLDGKPVPFFGVSVSDDPTESYGKPTPVRDPDGRFIEKEVKPGTVAVIVVGPGFARHVVEHVVVAPGQAVDLGDVAVSPGLRLRGRVVDERGAPVAGATVQLGDDSAHREGTLRALKAGGFSATTDAQGNYELVGLSPTPDERELAAFHPTVGSSGPRGVPGGDDRADLVLHATGVLEGTVALDPRGSERPDHVSASASDGARSYDAEVDDAGAFRFAQLPPGDYLVRPRTDARMPAVRAHVTANARTAVAIAMPEHVVELRVEVPGGCELLTVNTVDDHAQVALELCEHGRATFAHLAAGAYELCADGGACRPIAVPPTAVHAITLAPVPTAPAPPSERALEPEPDPEPAAPP